MVSERVSCSLGVLLLLLLLLVGATHSSPSPVRRGTGRVQEGGCSGQCVPLPQCPHLLHLLTTNNSQDIHLLQEATCSFRGKEPQVCCSQGNTHGESSLLPQDCGQTPLVPKIVEGRTVPLGTFPWLAVLGFSGEGSTAVEFLCGGSIINHRYVLTAAHCVHPSVIGSRRLEVVRLGEWDLTTDPDCQQTLTGLKLCGPAAQDVAPEEVTLHPHYNTRANFSDDIALVRLSHPIDLSGEWIHPVCLPPQGLDVRRAAGGRMVVVAGWELTENGASKERLLRDSLLLVDDESCSSAYNVKLVDGQVCLRGRPGLDSCAGDSGGPVVLPGPNGPPFLQVGVVSYGPVHCDRGDSPGVYTSVSHYRDWIEKNLKV